MNIACTAPGIGMDGSHRKYFLQFQWPLDLAAWTKDLRANQWQNGPAVEHNPSLGKKNQSCHLHVITSPPEFLPHSVPEESLKSHQYLSGRIRGRLSLSKEGGVSLGSSPPDTWTQPFRRRPRQRQPQISLSIAQLGCSEHKTNTYIQKWEGGC